MGASPQELGSPLNQGALTKVSIGLGYARVEGGCVELKVIHTDKYGNVILSQYYRELASKLKVRASDIVEVRSEEVRSRACIEKSFSSTSRGTLILYGNSYGYAELAINQGSAQSLLKVRRGDVVRICRRRNPEG